MKITAVNPPYLTHYSRGQRSPAVTKSGTLYYPIWLAYAVGALKHQGHEIDLIDAPADDLSVEDVIIRIAAFKPNLVIVETSTPSIVSDVEFADKISMTGIFTVLVGTHPTALPNETMALGTSFEAIVCGEYENPLTGLAKALESGASIDGVKGLYLRCAAGTSKSTGTGERMQNLDNLPFVSEIYREYLTPGKYNNPNALYPQVMIMGGRGCPHRCSFCVFPQTIQGRKFRYRSLENIVAEMLWVEKNMPEIRAIFFEDDTISVDRKRLRTLAQRIIDAGVSISWTSNMRANVDYETLKICREAGLRSVCVGFESGSDVMLENMNKGINTASSKKFAEDAAKAGILVHGCFMVGTKGETHATMEQTLEFALKLAPDTVQFYPMMVYPGTDAYNQAIDAGYITAKEWKDWLTEDGLHNCVVRTAELTSKELVDFCDYARRRFYLRPSYIIKKIWMSIFDKDERKRTFKAFNTFRRYLFRNSRK